MNEKNVSGTRREEVALVEAGEGTAQLALARLRHGVSYALRRVAPPVPGRTAASVAAADAVGGAAVAVGSGGGSGGFSWRVRWGQARAEGRVIQLAVVRRRGVQHRAVPDDHLPRTPTSWWLGKPSPGCCARSHPCLVQTPRSVSAAGRRASKGMQASSRCSGGAAFSTKLSQRSIC